MKSLALLLLTATFARAAVREFPVPKSVDLAVLSQALRDGGFVALVNTDKEGNKMVLLGDKEAKDPTSVIEAVTPQATKDAAIAVDDLKTELLDIQDKILTDKATKEDIARVLAIVLELLEKK